MRLWPHNDQPSGKHLRRFETTFRASFAVFAVAISLWLLTAGPAMPVAHSSGRNLGLFVAAAMAFASMSANLRWHPAVTLLTTTAAMLVVAATLTAPYVATSFLLGIHAYALAMELTLRGVLVGWASSSALYIAVRAQVDATQGFFSAVDDVVLCGTITLTGAAFLRVIVRNLAEVDARHRESVARQTADALDLAEAEVLLAQNRIVHDAVIVALSAIERAPTSAVSDEDARAMARKTVANVEGHHDASSDAVHLDYLVRQAATSGGVEASIPGTLPDVLVPTDQREPIERALNEALRNVARHGEDASATVTWSVVGDAVELIAENRVAQMPSTSTRRSLGGWGHINSVVLPLRSLGGDAHMSRTGDVVQVGLSWPSVQGAAAPREGRWQESMVATAQAIGDQRGLVWQTSLPMLGANTYLLLRYTLGDPTAAVEILLALLLAAGTVRMGFRLVLLTATAYDVLALAAWSAIAIALGLQLAEDQSVLGYDSWVIGYASVGLTLAAFFAPPRWLTVLIVPSFLVVLATTIGQGIPLSKAVGALNSPVTPPVLGCMLGWSLRWSARKLREEARETSLAAASARRSFRVRRADHSDPGPLPDVVGFLSEVADGSVDVRDPAVGERAARMLPTMRDELALPGLMDVTLRARLARRRDSGVHVSIPAPEGRVRDTAFCLRLVDRLLDSPTLESLVVLQLPTIEEPRMTVSVAPPLTGPDEATMVEYVYGLDARVDSDIIATTLTVEFPALGISTDATTTSSGV